MSRAPAARRGPAAARPPPGGHRTLRHPADGGPTGRAGRGGGRDLLLASHYGAPALAGIVMEQWSKLGGKTGIGRLGDILDTAGPRHSMWVWGHSHSERYIRTVREIAGRHAVRSVEVGSTTDFPNFGVVIDWNGEGTFGSNLEPYPLCQLFSTKACQQLARSLDSKPLTDLGLPEQLRLNRLRSADALGLTKRYRDPEWKTETDRAVTVNIDYFVGLHADYGFADSAPMKLCLLRLASAAEKNQRWGLGGLDDPICRPPAAR